MNSSQTKQQKCGFCRTVELNLDEAIEKTREALKTEGFGVLSEIRLDEKLKEKLGVDFRRCIIFVAPSRSF